MNRDTCFESYEALFFHTSFYKLVNIDWIIKLQFEKTAETLTREFFSISFYLKKTILHCHTRAKNRLI